MKKMIKRIIFAVIIIALVLGIGVVIKSGKFEKLEGYMYSFAAEITNSATDSNATSSNAQQCATSSNATSSNAQQCATSSNATSSNAQQCATSSNATSSNAQQSATSSNATSSNAQQCATSSNATSSNAQITEIIKVTNSKTNTQINLETEEIENVEEYLTYNNSEITQNIIKEISNSKETQSITINLDNNVNISEDIFTAIKGKSTKLAINVGENQIIFNGKNITTPKEINAEISYNLASEDVLLKEIVQEGVVINFANNGELPGIATVRIKVTDEMKQALNMNKILVYHYDEETKELTQMTANATYKEDGFIEFSINHNSKYLLVNELIEEKQYSVTTGENTEVKNEVSFLESHKMYIMIIGVSVLAIVIVAIILIIDKKAISKKDDKANNEEK